MNGMLICILHGCMVTIWVTWSVLLSKLGTLHIILKALGVVASSAVVYVALGFYIRELFRCTYKRVFQIPMFREDETKIATTEFLMSKKECDDRPTIQRIFESLYKGGFGKHDKGRHTQ